MSVCILHICGVYMWCVCVVCMYIHSNDELMML